jgi:hypothetical protein
MIQARSRMLRSTGLAALGLGEVLAVGREPGEPDVLAGEMVERIDLVDVLRQVERVG